MGDEKFQYCVVDTNVPICANADSDFSKECATACAKFLQSIMKGDVCLVLDSSWRILNEYMNKLRPNHSERRPGDAFLKWVLDNRATPANCKQVQLQEVAQHTFEEFPNHDDLRDFDDDDRKFVAVAYANGPPTKIAEATDSEWIKWQEALEEVGIELKFICPDEIEQQWEDKYGDDE